MSSWIIEPHHAVIFRDGRPFGPNPGARAATLSYPFPSTTTGGLRTRAGQDPVSGKFSRAPEEVLKIEVRGPLLVELDKAGNFASYLIPAPADALLLDVESHHLKEVLVKRLLPLALPDGASTDLPDSPDPLLPVGPIKFDARKPHKWQPRFWHWATFQSWLMQPADEEIRDLDLLGHGGPTVEKRMHVSILPGQGTAQEGALFQTQGLEFAHRKEDESLAATRRLALAVVADHDLNLRVGMGALGGERRLVRWDKSDASLPECSTELREAIFHHRACRVVLLTPACFSEGYRPTWLLQAETDYKATLRAAVVGRPQVVSGWDLVRESPKPTRRLAPAGSVFFLSFPEDMEARALHQWIDAVWMRNISDAPQDRLDGFGLAALGTWDGQPRKMQEEVFHET